MALKKLSELAAGTASLTSIVPMSDAGGTATNKVTVQSILNADARWSVFLPAAPTSLVATGGNAQVSLSWTAPTVLAQTPITDYVVQYSSNSGSSWTTFADGTSSSTGATVTGLTNGTAYVFRVAAVNGIGTGSYTVATGSVTPNAANFVQIPSMTSATAPSGNVYSSGAIADSRWADYGAFDNDASSLQIKGSLVAVGSYLQYAFANGQLSLINGYSIKHQSGENIYSTISAWTMHGSTDGSNWTLLDTRSGYTWPSPGTTQTFSLAAPAAYSQYRWTFTASYDGNPNVWIGEIKLVA